MRLERIVLFLTLLFVCTLAITPALSAAPESPRFAVIDTFVESQMARHRIPGLALAITQDNEIVHGRGFGMADEGREVTLQTPFYIGSVSKSLISAGPCADPCSRAGLPCIYRTLRPAGLLSITEQPGDPDFLALPTVRTLAEQEGFEFVESYGRSENYSANFRKPERNMK